MISDTHKYQIQHRANKIFKVIRDFETLFPDEFRKCGINSCGHCGGTGIADRHQLTVCVNCGGMGYKGFEKIEGDFVCRSCNGYACDICNHTGIVDWITHANGSDMIGKRMYL